MIRLTAEPADDHYAFTLSRGDQVLITSIDPIEVAERMLAVGIENPLYLVEAARQWGVVEVKEEPHSA
jgi:hypothetical protein